MSDAIAAAQLRVSEQWATSLHDLTFAEPDRRAKVWST